MHRLWGVVVVITAVIAALAAPRAHATHSGCGLLGLAKCPHTVAPATPPAYPDPGGNENAAVSVPPGNGKLFGFSDNAWQEEGVADLGIRAPTEYRWAAGAGANAHRILFGWRSVEPARDVWADGSGGYLRRVQELYDLMRAGGKRPLVVLAYAPSWAADGEANGHCSARRIADCKRPPADTQEMLAEWREYVEYASDRFPAADFEIWNEPNLSIAFQPAANPARYARLVRVARDAIAARNATFGRRSKVVAGGLAQNQEQDGTSIRPQDFLAAAYANGLLGTYDVISWHVYPYVRAYTMNGLGAGSYFARDWERFRAVLAARDPGARIWVTETGVTTTGTTANCGGFLQPACDPDQQRAVSPEAQRDWLLRLYRKLLTMPDVDAVFVHQLFDRASLPTRSHERGYGLAYPNGGTPLAKPSFCAFRQLAGTSGAFAGC